jgi:acyl-CoA dehydrogenase
VAPDFSTEPEFQEQPDRVEQFCRTEVVPLDLLFAIGGPDQTAP